MMGTRFSAALSLTLALMIYAAALLPSRADASSVQFRAAEQAGIANGGVESEQVSNITFVGHGSSNSSNGSSVTPNLPTHTTGDFLLCLVTRGSTSGVTAPSGWNSVYNPSLTSGGHTAAAFWKIAASGNEITPTFTRAGGGSSNGMVGRCSAFRGVDQSAPIDAYAAQYTFNNDYVRSGSLTPTTSGTMVLFAPHFNVDTSLDAVPSGWNTNSYFSTGANRGVALYHRPWSTTPVGPVEIDIDSNANSHGVLIALRPAVPSPPAPAPGSLTINKPAGTLKNDVMVASIAVTANTATAVASIGITPPPGWTLIRAEHQSLGSDNNGNRHSRLATYVRAATAGEPASYTWSFTGSSHMGAVGGIATFSGVYVNPLNILDSIDDHAGAITASSRDHTAPGITTTVDRGMLLTSHEYASSQNWAAYTNMGNATEAVDIASQSDGSAGISMGMYYEPRPNAGATGTRTARAGSGTDDRGATHSIGLKPVPMSCTGGDDFNRPNGPPGSNWIVSNSGGSFGNPVIVNNRLRLTDATGNVATMATLERLFPGAGNRIEIEFQHFAYGGNGADGIVVVLSDASVPPTPGGYGGSLGYAQNTSATPSKPGFGGGWLGIGIDEYGNFSNPTEGRQGGPGLLMDSVAIRGSGSGYTGYAYQVGTPANRNPQIDNNGSANPPHQYRIIVDHSNATNAWVTVERDTGSGYQMLISRYDAKAMAGQAAVPEKWILSWTGSTGGSTNIHEIDGLQICATHMEALAPTDHYAVQHATSAVNCQPETITITARDASNQAISAEGATITVTARRVAGTPAGNRGDWILVSGAGTLNNGGADDGVATYTFGANEQQVVLALKNTHPQTVNIDVADNLGITENSGAGNTEPGYNQNLAFGASGFRITNNGNPPVAVSIANQAAGVASATYALQAIRTDNSSGACVSAFADNTDVNVDLAFQCNNPTTCQSGQLVGITNNGVTSTIAANPGSGVSNYTQRSLRFGANSQAPFTLVYPDVGQITLHARHNILLPSGNPSGNYMLGASNAFTVKPYDLIISDIKRTAGGAANPEAADANGAVFVRAGESFSATATAVNAQGNATPNYGKESAPEGVKLVSALVGGLGLSANPALANEAAFAAFSGGAATGTTFSWNEVGIIRLTAEVADGDYLGAGNVGGPPSANVGRFIPNHFTLSGGTLKNRSSAACSPDSSFTYMDEPLLLKYSLVANNASGGTTQNYAGAFAKLNVASVTAHGFGVRDTPSGTDLSGRLGVVSLAGGWSSGTADIDAVVSIARDAAPDGPYNGLRIGVAPVDGDGVRLTTTALDMDADGNAPNDHAQIGAATQVRFGRLRVLNALGSERLPLPIPMRVEYWSGNAFVVNGDDSCTRLPYTAISAGNYTSNLAACETAFTNPNISFVGGKATPVPMLAAPGNLNNGSVDLLVNVGTAASGQYCTGVGGTGNQAAASPAAMSYLKGRWNDAVNGTGYDDDPIARAAFGMYGPDKASKRMIYTRENY